jgi:hypothetical protein
MDRVGFEPMTLAYFSSIAFISYQRGTRKNLLEFAIIYTKIVKFYTVHNRANESTEWNK